jgi:hypothetical protein
MRVGMADGCSTAPALRCVWQKLFASLIAQASSGAETIRAFCTAYGITPAK